MVRKGTRITLATVLEHIQATRGEIVVRIDRIEQRMDRMESRMDRMEQNLDHLKMNMGRMERNLTAQIDAIDRRLDDVEVVQVPKLKKAVGMR